ncbi:MAG TPA: exodeoxyribonuclease V subunit alpha, partial [Aldersonia sp.]
MTSARIALRGQGLLHEFNEAGVLAAADVHVALRLARLGREPSQDVTFATALAVRAVRAGSVCLDLNRLRDVTVDETIIDEDRAGAVSIVDLDALPWPDRDDILAALRVSPLVVGDDTRTLRPLRLVDTDEGELLYLDRYYLQERTIREVLDARTGTRPALDLDAAAAGLHAIYSGNGVDLPAPDRQRVAAALAATEYTSVIAGGPGTGKTHTVARVLALLFRLHGPGLRVGLAAPTGKAAARLQEEVREQAAELGLPSTLTAMTLHRLLGWQPGSNSRFRHNRDNRLPYDVIVVDETSMVSLTLMSRLLEALRSECRLVLVGDPDQLASVDAGAVLADLVARPVSASPNPALTTLVGADLESFDADECDRLAGGVVRLTAGRRFGGDIAALAAAVRIGDADAALELLNGGSEQVSFHAPDDLAALRADVLDSARITRAAALTGDANGALDGLEAHRLLCAHREGPFGARWWAQQAVDWIGESRAVAAGGWYPGQPLLVTANDYEIRLYNGDTGVVLVHPAADAAADGAITAAFARGSEPFFVHPSHIAAVQTAYAMTIHRSQGSQYRKVSVILPESGSSLLTRELLYTALTRAQHHIRIVGPEAAVR